MQFAETPSKTTLNVQVATAEQAEQVKRLLGSIYDDFGDAERVAQRHKVKPQAPTSFDAPNEQMAVEVLTERVKAMAIRRQKATSVTKKARWALHDEKKMRRLIEDLDSNITDLVQLFPKIEQTQQSLARKQASELIQSQPTEVKKLDDGSNSAVSVLQEAASDVDKMFESAIQKAVAQARYGHEYVEINSGDKTRVEVGKYVAPGNTVTGLSHRYGKMNGYGEARIRYGDNYGGKSVFDD